MARVDMDIGWFRLARRLCAPVLGLALALLIVSPVATLIAPPSPPTATPSHPTPTLGQPDATLQRPVAPWLLVSPVASARVTVRDGGVRIGEQPFFPMGFYYVSWDETPAQMLATLRMIAAAGFNTVHAGYTPTNGYEQFLDEAARLGVRVITEGADPATIATLRDKPAVLAWNIGDDVHENMTPDALGQHHTATKQLDPNHPTYFTVYRASRWGPYLDKGDLVAPYSYPIPDADLGAVDRALDQARRTGYPLIGIPQAFAWPGKRAPTPAEARNMVYQNLVNGVRGLIAYNYNERGPLPSTDPELWAAYAGLVPEVGVLAPALAGGRYAKLATGAEGVLAAQWSYAGTLYLILLNTSEQSGRRVSLPLPSGTRRMATPLFADRPAGLRVEGSRLAGTINAGDVHVYTLPLTTGALAPPLAPLSNAVVGAFASARRVLAASHAANPLPSGSAGIPPTPRVQYQQVVAPGPWPVATGIPP